MHLDEEEALDFFELLDELSSLPEDELKERHTKENVDGIVRIANLLADARPPAINSADDFVFFVYALRELKKVWAKIFGEVMVSVYELTLAGDSKAALVVLDEFVAKCSSSYYRDLAEKERDCYL